MGRKRHAGASEETEGEYDLPAKHMNTSHIRANERRLIIVLEGAQLETVKVVGFGNQSQIRQRDGR